MMATALLLLASSVCPAQEPPRKRPQDAEQRVEAHFDREWRELLERLPDSARVEVWRPGMRLIDGRLYAPLDVERSELWTMPRVQLPEVRLPRLLRRSVKGGRGVTLGNGNAGELGSGVWGVGVYPGNYLDARTLSFPMSR